MMIAKTTQTNTIETKFEYDESGKMTRRIVTETLEVPEVPAFEATVCACDCNDIDEDSDVDIDVELEAAVSPLDVIMGAAGIASIIASGCMIVKALRK